MTLRDLLFVSTTFFFVAESRCTYLPVLLPDLPTVERLSGDVDFFLELDRRAEDSLADAPLFFFESWVEMKTDLREGCEAGCDIFSTDFDCFKAVVRALMFTCYMRGRFRILG